MVHLGRRRSEATVIETKQLAAVWKRAPEYMRLLEAVEQGEGPHSIQGVPDGPGLHLVASLLKETGRKALLICHNEQEAQRTAEELGQFLWGVVHLPPREIQLTAFFAAGRELSDRRIRALNDWMAGRAQVLVASTEAAIQAMAPPEQFYKLNIEIVVGEWLPQDELLKDLMRAGYERVDKVDGQGQFRLAGGIADIYVPGEENPYRIEFFDDEVDSIREFDTASQRSLDKRDRVQISAATEAPLSPEAIKRAVKLLKAEGKKAGEEQKARIDGLLAGLAQGLYIEGAEQLIPYFYEEAMLTDYRPEGCLTFLMESRRIEEAAEGLSLQYAEKLSQSLEDGRALKEQSGLMIAPGAFWMAVSGKDTLAFSVLSRLSRQFVPRSLFQFMLKAAPEYNARLDMLAKDLHSMQKDTSVLIYAGDRAKQVEEALRDGEVSAGRSGGLTRQPMPGEVLVIEETMQRGYESTELRLVLLGEGDLFGVRKQPVKAKKRKSSNRLELFSELKIGDYVVHEKYGIGQFKGIETHESGGGRRDFLVIQYAGSDRVGVSTDELDRVQKYIGSGEAAPRMSKLGGADWGKQVNKARASVKDLAFDLVKLYAEREKRRGFAFSKDTVWQKELEDAFPYEETEGQLNALRDIKRDMESHRVMDRLLCGDVGYGKTEVALRAIFKAVQDGKQTAFLVPTTILAQQHYMTLRSRYDKFPVSVEVLSRLRSAKEQRETLKRLKDGRCDVVIGTHKILGKDVAFKDLGLLVIDEEQRFGVGHKEMIKERKKDVDVLSLSATPIPRTLHMSMTGIRDMSVIDTPPEERYPVQTYVMEYSDEIIRDAIRQELRHGGQVYFLYNDVAGMDRMMGHLQEVVPEARFAMAHGQMPQGQLENTMLAFMEREIDVLLCSTIIESGLDIPNVNTIVVYDADRYGVSQLYQLRGRVGRSNRMAYAYLTVRPDKVLSEVAEKRLRALREFTEFGSGFKIAMRDLEIRGSGDLLGPQQHGHLNAVGYDYYVKLLEEALREARGEQPEQKVETQLEIPVDAHISRQYIRDEAQRLEMYKRIASIENQADFYDVQEELEDRFGELPEPVQMLLDVALLKAQSQAVGIDNIAVREGEARLRFHASSKLDGAHLITIMQESKGLDMLPGHADVMRFRQSKASSAAIVHSIAPIVAKMFCCISDGVQV